MLKMKINDKKNYLVKAGLLIFFAISTTGCDQLKSKLAGLSQESTPKEVSANIDKLVEKRDFKKAIEQGDNFLKNNQDPDGLVADSITKAYVAAGDTAGLLSYLSKQKANPQSAGDKNLVSSDDAERKADNAQPTSGISAGNASVTQTKDGTVVKAGSAVVVLPK
jgi:hypothetical protein